MSCCVAVASGKQPARELTVTWVSCGSRAAESPFTLGQSQGHMRQDHKETPPGGWCPGAFIRNRTAVLESKETGRVAPSPRHRSPQGRRALGPSGERAGEAPGAPAGHRRGSVPAQPASRRRCWL